MPSAQSKFGTWECPSCGAIYESRASGKTIDIKISRNIGRGCKTCAKHVREGYPMPEKK